MCPASRVNESGLKNDPLPARARRFDAARVDVVAVTRPRAVDPVAVARTRSNAPIKMFSISSVSVVSRARVARVANASQRRGVRARAESADKPSVSADVDAASREWKEVAASESGDGMKFTDAIDPADGSIAEARPLGNDNSLIDAAMVAFKDSRAVEIINGRVAMTAWMMALAAEFSSNTSVMGQVFHSRTFTLADGVTRTSTYPGAGFFLIPVVVLAVLAASLAPALKKSSPNGLNEKPNTFGPFNPEAEMTNGRGAMVGLVALPLAEKILGGSALF